MVKLVTRHLSLNRSSENNNPREIGKMDELHRRSERPRADPRDCSASELQAFIWEK